jgi:hypothetical protein
VKTAVSNSDWVEAQQKGFAERGGAVLAFWPEFRRAVIELAEQEPVKGRIETSSPDSEPYQLTLSGGLFDLKVAADVLGDTIFYAFTSSSLKKLIPRESAIFHHGQLKLTRGYWGVIDGPGVGISKVFVDDPQAVEHFPLADRFAQWCVEGLLGGYATIIELEKSAVAEAKAKEEAAKKEAKNAGGNSRK